ncbi:MAG: ComF family protein [Granulosicoccus sp.]
MSIFSAWTQRSAEFIEKRLKFDGFCTLCACPTQNCLDLCAACQGLLTSLQHTDESGAQSQVCAYCGLLSARDRAARAHADDGFGGSYGNIGCAACENKAQLLVRIVAPFRYEFPLNRMIQQMKYREQRQMGRVLGSLLANTVRKTLMTENFPDLLIPVPMHRNKALKRGFNQAQDIAKWCARDLRLPVGTDCVRRIVDTESLAGLTRAERQYRILGAFQASAKVTGKRVAIVDDVLTTGSTARELARELYDTGASSVELWVLARTSRRRLDD